MRLHLLLLLVFPVCLLGHPDAPPDTSGIAQQKSLSMEQETELRYYFNLFTGLINQTITPYQQEIINLTNEIYPCLTSWEDGGDPSKAITDSGKIVGRLKNTLKGYSVEWTEQGLSTESKIPLSLTYGLDTHIWLNVSNGTKQSLEMTARESSQPASPVTTTIGAEDSKVIMLRIPGRARSNDKEVHILLQSKTGEPEVRDFAIPISISDPAVISGQLHEGDRESPWPGRLYVVGSDGIGRVGRAYKGNRTLSEKMIFEILSENKFATYQLPFFYSDGAFEVHVPSGEVDILLERGYEHKLEKYKVTASAGETKSVTLNSERFIDMKQLGWISGDTHIHWVKNWWSENEDIELLAMAQRAEDLRVANNLTLFQYRPEDQGGNFLAPSQFPIGPVESLSDQEYHIQMAEEFRNDNFYGHLCFLNISSLIQPVSTGQGSGGPPGTPDWPLNKTAIEACHTQGGISTEAHNLGPNHRSDVPVNAVMGLSDAFDQMDPEHYYRFLDCGLKIPLGNGSDHPARTIGSARMYVKVEGYFSYQGWIDGIKAGRTFTTSGPLVFLEVNGHEIGDTLELSKGDSLEIRATVHSRNPIGHFQILSNGEVLAEAMTSETEAVLDFKMTADKGRWIVARCSPTDTFSALLHPDVAHTSGIYVHVDGQGPFNAEAARFWLNLLKAHQLNVQQNAQYGNDEQRQAQLDYIQSGIDKYEALIAKARGNPT